VFSFSVQAAGGWVYFRTDRNGRLHML
jgi:hypothetical protein